MRLFPSLASLIGAVAICGPLAGADPKHPAPASAADVAATQAAIAALAQGPVRDLGAALAQVNARLDRLEAELQQASRGLGAANLPELVRREAANTAAAAGLGSRQDRLETALEGAQSRLAESAAATAAAIQDLKRQQGNADSRLGAVQEGWESRLESAVKALTAQAAAAAAAREGEEARASGALAQAVLGGAALLAVLIAAAAWLEHRGRRSLRRELSLTLARHGSEFRQALATAAAQATAATPPDWLGQEVQPSRLAEWAEPEAPPTLRVSASAAPGSDRPTLSVGPPLEPAVASRLLWPADFLDPESPLSRWRFLLEGHLADEEHPALPVLTHLLGLRAFLRSPATAAPAEVASALFRLSESLHAYWHSLADLSAEDRQQASADWLHGMRALLAGFGARLDLREIMPGVRVDPDLMHAVSEGPGNHLNVADVFSWAVVDRTGGRPRVLHRAQIAST